MSGSELLVERHGAVVDVVLNRPHRRNALSPTAIERLGDVFTELAGDADLGAVVLSGAGDFFCSGLDLKEIDPSNAPREQWLRVHQALARVGAPVVGAVAGGAVNAGAALALACDLLVVGETAYVQVMEASMGIGAPLNAAWLARRYPAAFGLQLALSCRPFRGPDLHRVGVAYEVLPDGEVVSGARTLAARLADFPNHGAALAKRDLGNARADIGPFTSTVEAVLAGKSA